MILFPVLALAASLATAGPSLARIFGSDYIPIEAPRDADQYLNGEFTGDGRADLLGIEYDGSMWLLVARRSGGFEEPRQLEGESEFDPMSASDLDGDGLTDLLGMTRSGNLAAIRRARLGGGFEPVEILPDTIRTRSMTAGDFDRDGRVDVAVADSDSARILVHSLGDDGTWEVSISRPVSPRAHAVRAGDYDGDGQNDLMVQFSSFQFLGFRGGVSFRSSPPDTHAVDILFSLGPDRCVLRDMDRDSKPEMVLISGYDGELYVCRQESSGSWTVASHRSLPQHWGGLVVADIDGDAWPDAAVIDQSGAYLWAFDNDRAGGFLDPRPILLPGHGRRMVVGSWFSDGEEIAVSTTNGILALVGHDPNVQPVSKTLLQLMGRDHVNVFPADLNGDGHLDLVLGLLESNETGTIWVAIGDGQRHFDLVERPIGFPPQVITVADVTGDGHPDLVAASGPRSAIWLFAGDGKGDFELGRQIFAGDIGANLFSKALMAADLDDDGDIDLALPGPFGELWVFSNPGDGLFGSPVVAPVRGFVTGLALADADDQSGQELYVLSYQPGLIQSFHLERNGRLVPLRVQESISRSDRQTLADLNGDCVEDFLLQVGSGDRVTIQYGYGQGAFGPPVFERLGRELAWATAGDTDQDGRDDLIAYAEGSGILLVRRGVPGGLGDTEEFAVGGALRDYVLVDLDADGRLDLIGTSDNSSDVLIIWNEGDPIEPGVAPAPPRLQLARVSPNPGRGQVQLDLAGLSPGESVELHVFDVSGRLVSSLGPTTSSAERLCLRWNGRGEDGSLVSSGVYTLRVRTDREQVTTRITLLR